MLLSNFIFLALSVKAWAAPDPSLLERGTHCVAYKAEKVTFLFNSGTVVGKNCDVSAQVLPEVGGLYHIEVVIPIRGFQSGDTDRDEDVTKTLKAELQPDITFRSNALTAERWRELFKKTNFEIAGELSIGQKSYPLKLASHYMESGETPEVDGVAKVEFKDFDIAPPKVVGGLIAKTKPQFELHFHFLGNRILGADSIRLDKPTAQDGVNK